MHYALSTNKYIIAIITLLALTACGGKKGELRIKGTIKGLNNAELILYSRDGVIEGIDTMRVIQGKLDWSCPYNKTSGSITIVYPTYSTLTVFGSTGDVITIDGDAKQLNSTKVGGNEDNKAYTMLRELFEQSTAQQIDSIKKDFYKQYPESPVTRHLQLEELAKETPYALRTNQPFPDFTLVTRQGDTITIDSIQGKYTLFAFWANWRGGTGTLNTRIRRLRRQAQQPLECISYNMDVNTTILNYIERTDSITWYSCNDQRVFQADLPSRLGIRDLPFYVLTDTLSNIIASGNDWQKDIEPSLGTITKEKETKE